jgi:hypothetical protein
VVFGLQHQFLMTMNQSYAHFDQDRSGSLSQAEVYPALQHAGATNLRLTCWQIEQLHQGFEHQHSLCAFVCESLLSVNA